MSRRNVALALGLAFMFVAASTIMIAVWDDDHRGKLLVTSAIMAAFALVAFVVMATPAKPQQRLVPISELLAGPEVPAYPVKACKRIDYHDGHTRATPDGDYYCMGKANDEQLT